MDAGCDGFVAFTAKNNLIHHYEDTLGAKVIHGQRMYIDNNAAQILIAKYLERQVLIMLVMTRKQYGNVVKLERYVNDGRLTEPSNGKRYNWKKMIDSAEKVGRPLNEKEIESYRIKQYCLDTF